MNRGILYYAMIPAMLLACLVQATAANRLVIGGVKPDLVLLLVLVGTLIYGGRIGVVWAFIGGLGLDIFSGGPMGSSSLALMAAALVAGLGHRTLSRYNLLVPVGVTMAGTLVYATTYLAILAALEYLDVAHHALPIWSTLQYVVAPVLLYNTTLIVVIMPFLNRVPESQDI
jgi:rod shape-determining protein MreD